MWTGHSQAWEDIWWVTRNVPVKKPIKIEDFDHAKSLDRAVIDMLEVVTKMRIENIIDHNTRTKAQIFFDEIDSIINYIIRTEWLKSDRKATIRHVALGLWITRQLIDGFFLYSWLITNGNTLFIGNLKHKLNKVPKWLHWDDLRKYWQENKNEYNKIIDSFESFKKIYAYYQHQN